MSYTFHDIKNIVQPYLDDLPAHSLKQEDHPMHFKLSLSSVETTIYAWILTNVFFVYNLVDY